MSSLGCGATLGLRRLLDPYLGISAGIGLLLVLLAARLERSVAAVGAAVRALVGAAFGIALPLLAYAVVARATAGNRWDHALDVLARHRDRFRVVALTARVAADRLYEQCVAHRPEYAVVVDPDGAQRLEQRLRAADLPTRVLAGPEGLLEVARLPQVDYVMAAIVGAAGLLPTLEAARAGKRILLANKEALVMSGRLFMEEVRRGGAVLLVAVDPKTNAVGKRYGPPAGSGAVRAGGGKVWVSAHDVNKVWALDPRR